MLNNHTFYNVGLGFQQITTMKKLILVANDAPTCGKSSIALVLAEYLTRRKIDNCLVTTSFEQETPYPNELLNLEDGIQAADFEDLLESHHALIIDVHTGGNQDFASFFHKNRLDEILSEMNAELTVLIPLCNDAAVHREALSVAEAYTGLGEFVALQCPLLADVEDAYEGSAIQKALNLLGATILTVPQLDDLSLDTIDEMDLNLPLALSQRSLLPRFLRQQLLAWEVDVADKLNIVSEFLVPRHDRTDNFGRESAYGRLLSA